MAKHETQDKFVQQSCGWQDCRETPTIPEKPWCDFLGEKEQHNETDYAGEAALFAKETLMEEKYNVTKAPASHDVWIIFLHNA